MPSIANTVWAPARRPLHRSASYLLKRSASSADPFAVVASGVTATSYVDTTALNGATNYYVVSSVSPCGPSANSAVVAVLLPLPELSASLNSGFFIVSWPGWANDWLLQSATNLVPPILWSRDTNAVSISNGQFIVTIPLGPGALFFRLVSP